MKVDEDQASATGLRLTPTPEFSTVARARTHDVTRSVRRLPGLGPTRRLATGASGLLLSFLLFVVVPTAVAGWYFAFVASDIYVSEAKFAVRGDVEKNPGGLAGNLLSQITTMNSNQDAFIVSNYIQSTPMLETLDKQHSVRSIYSRPGVDWLSRLDPSASVEDLRQYWGKMVEAQVDNLSGLVTLDVKAFNPQDALNISKVILAASEALVNEISVRRRDDAVRFAKEEVARAETRLKAARLAVEDFRNRSGVLDPVKSAEADLKLAMQLRSDKIELENQLATNRGTLSANAPSVQVLTARLAALNGQIQTLDRQITDTDSADAKTASRILSQYEGLELERQFAGKFYLTTQKALETARMNADRQQIYLVTFVPPGLAEMPLFPHRAGNVFVMFACCAGLWSIFSLLIAAVKDHRT